MSKREIKVLHIGLSSNVGGIETVVYNWLRNIDREQIQFDFINVEDKPLAFEDEFIEAGCNVYKISSRKSDPLKSYRQLRDIMENNHYDFVHHHVMGITWPEPTLIAAEIPGTLPVIHNHIVFGWNNGLSRVVLNMIGHLRLRGCDYLKLACGYDAGNSVFPKDSFKVINNGIDYQEKKFNSTFRDEIRDEYGIAEDTVLIGHVGRGSSQKNYPYILNTISKLNPRDKTVKFMLVGDIDKDESIRDGIKSLGISDKVIITGKVRNVERYYSAFDIFFFPSLYEGVSVSLIEAQCSGLPCVISRNIAKETEISDLINYVDIENADDGVNVLQKVAPHSNLERGQVAIAQEFNIHKTVSELTEFYRMNMK